MHSAWGAGAGRLESAPFPSTRHERETIRGDLHEPERRHPRRRPRAAAAGFKTDRVRQGSDEMLGGAKGGVSYLVSARPLASGRTEVDLITSGR